MKNSLRFTSMLLLLLVFSACNKERTVVGPEYTGTWGTVNYGPYGGAIIHIHPGGDGDYGTGGSSNEQTSGTVTIDKGIMHIGKKRFEFVAGPGYDSEGNYCIRLDRASFCSAFIPKNVHMASIDQHSAFLMWDTFGLDVAEPQSFTVQYKKTSDSTWTTINFPYTVTTQGYHFNGLSSGTSYDYQVKANYDPYSSAFTPGQMFTTQ